jgi:hypothetical protein
MPGLRADDLWVDYSGLGPDGSAAADRRARGRWEEHGCFLARGLLDDGELGPIRRDLRRLIALRREALGLPESPAGPGARFDDGLPGLVAVRRTEALVVQDAFRLLLSVQQVGVSPPLVRLSRQLLGTETIGLSPTNNNAKVSLPGEDEYLFPWHQDYPYVQDSEDGLVYWAPLHDCGEEEGCLWVAPGSHKLGLLPLRRVDPSAGTPVLAFELADPGVADRFPRVRVPVRAGDVLVFSTLLLHAGGANRCGRPRWTLQIRHGNFEHPRAVGRGWPSARVEKVSFAVSHPGYVVGGGAE